jgi:hypothetical protein
MTPKYHGAFFNVQHPWAVGEHGVIRLTDSLSRGIPFAPTTSAPRALPLLGPLPKAGSARQRQGCVPGRLIPCGSSSTLSKVGKDKKAFDIDETLCELKKQLKEHLEEYKELVRQPTHVCRKCGRAAKSATNLCRPEDLY